jgi:hypothetical protein
MKTDVYFDLIRGTEDGATMELQASMPKLCPCGCNELAHYQLEAVVNIERLKTCTIYRGQVRAAARAHLLGQYLQDRDNPVTCDCDDAGRPATGDLDLLLMDTKGNA